MGAWFGVLGALRVRGGDGAEHCLKPSRAAILLAELLMHPNELVTSESLFRVMWGDYVPTTARAALHTYVSRLRHLLTELDVDPGIVETATGGYLVSVRDDELDLLQFRQLVTGAQLCAGSDDELPLLRAALRLRNGDELLANVPSEPVRAELVALVDAVWPSAAERYFDLRLQSVDEGELAALQVALTHTVESHPLHPRFGEQLAEVLWRTGDLHRALTTFSSVHAFYQEVLHAAPSAAFLALGQNLRAAAAGGMPSGKAWRRERTRAPAMPRLVGRDPELAAVAEHLRRRPGAVAVVTGAPGSGKTALAVAAAQQVCPSFIRSGIFARMRDECGLARRPDAVVEEIDAHLRESTAEQSRVVVLDDAVSVEQVLAVAPAIDASVIVTARRALPELAVATSAFVCRLTGLPADCASELLGETLGRRRVAAEPDAAAEVAARCGGIPLALRMAGVRLSQRPAQTLREYASALAGDPVAFLSAGAGAGMAYVDVAVAFLGELETDVRSAFALLAAAGDSEFCQERCAQLFGVAARSALELLDVLIDCNLVDEHQPGRYRLDPLLRNFASSCPDAPLGVPGTGRPTARAIA